MTQQQIPPEKEAELQEILAEAQSIEKALWRVASLTDALLTKKQASKTAQSKEV